MTFCLAIMALTAMGMNVYIAFKTNHILGWDEIILPFIGPLLVVWHERGITLKENRDMLKAMLGKAPSSTIMESVASRIKYSNGNSVQRIEEETVDIRLPKKKMNKSYIHTYKGVGVCLYYLIFFVFSTTFCHFFISDF